MLDFVVNVCLATLLINALNLKEVKSMSQVYSANCLKYWFAIWNAEDLCNVDGKNISLLKA